MSELVLQPDVKKVSKRKAKSAIKNEKFEILDKINNILVELECLNNRFNNVTESDLIDSCIYEINALNMRYSYYMKLCKEKGIKN